MTESDTLQPSPSPADLRALMDALGLSMADLAHMVRVDRATVGHWLRGRSPVPRWIIAHLSLLQELESVCRGPESYPPARLTHHLDAARRVDGTNTEETHSDIPMRPNQSVTMRLMQAGNGNNLTPDGFTQALAQLGWKQADFARAVGCDVKTPSRWATGAGPVPEWVGAYLGLLLEVQRLQKYLTPPRDRKARSSP